VPSIEPMPTFLRQRRTRRLRVGIVDAPTMHEAVLEICRRAYEAHLGEEALMAMIEQAALRHGGIACLAGRAPEVLEFTVAKV
jgi:hypothetical protein